MINSRFAVAVHLLTLMAVGREHCPSGPLTSEKAAESVNTNPVVVRRILGNLRRAGIVSSQPGPTGGWFLEREPDQISLCDVYGAVEEENLFSLHHRTPSVACPVGRHIQHALQGYFGEAEQALRATLGNTTIGDVAKNVTTQAGILAS